MLRVVTLTFAVAVGIVVLGGCSSTSKTAAAPQQDVLNVAATPTAEPVAAMPISDAPIAMAMPAPLPAQTSIAAEPATSAKTYTVKKGDTLFAIAKTQTGSGRNWQKLVSANPGLDPKKLKVGQTITIPS